MRFPRRAGRGTGGGDHRIASMFTGTLDYSGRSGLFARAGFVGVVVMGLDFGFHALLTEPMETVFYFVGPKLLGAAAMYYAWRRWVRRSVAWEALAFGLLVSGYYFLAELLGYRWALYAPETPHVLGLSDPWSWVLWPVWHGAFYLVAILLAEEAFHGVAHVRGATR